MGRELTSNKKMDTSYHKQACFLTCDYGYAFNSAKPHEKKSNPSVQTYIVLELGAFDLRAVIGRTGGKHSVGRPPHRQARDQAR